jgi:diadenosine tetraphosphate (Ap4A) HIT family hydrolase
VVDKAPRHFVMAEIANILPPMSDPAAWSLHPQLAADTHAVGDLPLSRVLIIKDANFPWVLLVPRQPGVSEILDLAAAEQAQLMREITLTGAALKEITACHKLNIAALGNVVPQLHVHIIARHKSDAAWPQPVWGKLEPRRYDGRTLDSFTALLRTALQLTDACK